jgi:cytochrome c-type biogenesis protein CcsB
LGSNVYLLLTLVLYSVGALQVVLHAVARSRLLTSWTVAATLVGFAVHTAGVSQRWTEAGHFPVVGLHDAVSFLAWTLVLVFLLVYLRTHVEALGLIVHPTAFALMVVANLTPAAQRGDPLLQSLFLPIHATLAFFGYAALFVAFAMGGLYLFQERELRSRSPRTFYYLIPSLESCDAISGRSVAVGFTFLTLAILTGMFWSLDARGRIWTGDAKEWSAVSAWLLYVALIAARHRAGWGGRRAALLGIAGFAAVAVVFLSLTLFGGVAGAGS